MTRQTTGQGPLRPPPGHVLQSHNSDNPPNHPQTALTTSTHNPKARSPGPAPPAQNYDQAPATDPTHGTDGHDRDPNSLQPRRPVQSTNNPTRGLPARPPNGLESQPQIPATTAHQQPPTTIHTRCTFDVNKTIQNPLFSRTGVLTSCLHPRLNP